MIVMAAPETDHLAPLRQLCCTVCGASPVRGITPGTADLRGPGDVLVSHGAPLAAHCDGCWRSSWTRAKGKGRRVTERSGSVGRQIEASKDPGTPVGQRDSCPAADGIRAGQSANTGVPSRDSIGAAAAVRRAVPAEARPMTGAELRELLSHACEMAGGRSAWARRHGVAPSVVTDTLAGRRDVSERVANALGLIRLEVFMPSKRGSNHG